MACNLIIVGASARAAAQSALRAGYRPWCVDLFNDRDLLQLAPAQRCPRDQWPHGTLELIRRAPCTPETPVLYTGAMENHPDLLRAIAREHPLLGCDADAVEQVRRPESLAHMAASPGLRFCRVLERPRWYWNFWPRGLTRVFPHKYLIKPRRSSSGRGVRLYEPGQKLASTEYLQEYIAGPPMSAIFYAVGGGARWLGATQQVVGDPEFGARDFKFVGNVGPIPLLPTARQALLHLGVALAQRFNLNGIFGVDAILDAEGSICPVEVNPRYTASIEVLEHATGCVALTGSTGSVEGTCFGKAVLYAKAHTVAPDLYELVDASEIADVPAIGEVIEPGQPICTLLARSATLAGCIERLHQLARGVYTRLAS